MTTINKVMFLVCLFDIGSGCRSHNNDNVHYVFTIPPQHLVSKNKFKISFENQSIHFIIECFIFCY